jgi:hypothetical protein
VTHYRSLQKGEELQQLHQESNKAAKAVASIAGCQGHCSEMPAIAWLSLAWVNSQSAAAGCSTGWLQFSKACILA